MYFKISKLHSWGKRADQVRRHNYAALPKNSTPSLRSLAWKPVFLYSGQKSRYNEGLGRFSRNIPK